MKKDVLLKQVTQFKNSPAICIRMLGVFLETKEIQQLENHENMPFSDYLNFIQNTHPTINPAELFTDPFLKKENKKEIEFINKFISDEIKKNPIMPCYEFKYTFRIIHKINEPASALAITPEGNIVSSTSYNTISRRDVGKIVLRDSSGNYIKTLANEPASGLAITPEGNIVSSTSHKTTRRRAVGKIVLRDSSGNYVKTLANEPASGLAITSEGNIVSSTSYQTNRNWNVGRIVLRDPSGNYMKTLVKNLHLHWPLRLKGTLSAAQVIEQIES